MHLTNGSHEYNIIIIEVMSRVTEILLINHVYFIINPLCHPWTATSFHLVYTVTLHGIIYRRCNEGCVCGGPLFSLRSRTDII